MLSRRGRSMTGLLCCLLWLPVLVWAAPTGVAQEAEVSLSSVQAQIDELMAARTVELGAVEARLDAAAPAERTAIEAEGARLMQEYETAYLTLVIQYHELTGNEVERARAVRMLTVLQSNTMGMTPAEEAPELAPIEAGTEGVTIDAQ